LSIAYLVNTRLQCSSGGTTHFSAHSDGLARLLCTKDGVSCDRWLPFFEGADLQLWRILCWFPRRSDPL